MYFLRTQPICEFMSCSGRCSNQVPNFFLEDDDELEHIKRVHFSFRKNEVALSSFWLKDQDALPLWNSLFTSMKHWSLFSNTELINTRYQEYKEGRMLTGEVKQRVIAVLSDLVDWRARVQVTEEVDENNLRCFLSIIMLPNWALARLGCLFLLRAHTHTSLKIHSLIL